VTVELASTRRFTAELDPRTDASQLWLRFPGRSGYMLRPIDWDRVVRAEYAGLSWSGRELHEAVAVLREAFPVANETSLVPLPRAAAPVAGPDSCPPPEPASPGGWETPRVRSLAVEIELVNWDGDVEADGLLLNLYPLDEHGLVIPVRATIDVELIGEQIDRARQQPFARMERWTEQVCVEDFFRFGAQYRLPFRQVHPEFDLSWAAKGLVHVRLNVPGEGVFEASASGVRLRPFSELRDRLQQATGQRFFEVERTGLGKRG
jgi:hypothetical protein